jgi:signal transduction histidine kinase
MWDACAQDSQVVVYEACLAFQKHAKREGDMMSAHTAWICGIMYNLGQMNVKDAYHVAQIMKADVMNDENSVEERYLVPNMMGHVYNTCGNIPGAQEELLESAEMIKGTRYEADSLPFIYLALAHVQLNNNLDEALRWVDMTMNTAAQHMDSPNYYRALADAYAIKAIVRFKQRDYVGFRQCIDLMEAAERRNKVPSGDLFLPYARIYKTLLDGNTERALDETDNLKNKKEQYLLKCDIYGYIGDNEKSFMTQRELMHKRDSITGVMIAENIHQQEEEMAMMQKQQKMFKMLNIILFVAFVFAVLTIVMMARNLLIRRSYQKNLLSKNQELEAANKHVMAANEMKTEFIRNVSHEIRTPLNIINGFAQVLTDGDNSFEPEERKDIADTISENTRQITSLVNKMLVLANETTSNLLSKIKGVDVVEICQRAIEAMPKTDAEKIKVFFDNQVQGGGTILNTNGDSLLLMLGNLLENSVKFTDEGKIVLRLKRTKTHFLFSVEDTGCGIPADKVDTIFERFTKVDEFKEGLGLGLAYCHETAQKLGGSLTLDSTSDAGTTFTLSLPIKLNTK